MQHLPAILRPQLQAGAQLRWVPAANYHITLVFLGNIQLRSLERLHQLAQATAERCVVDRLVLDELQWFPRAVKPRMLVAVPAASDTLAHLHRTLRRELGRAGFAVEKREFRPHVTLARIKHHGHVPDLGQYPLSIKTDMDELILFKSEMQTGGSVYTQLMAEPLQG